MRLVYMGTPDFAVGPLEALAEAGFEILRVYSQPDRPKGRGMTLAPPPVKVFAAARGIEVRQPEKVRDGAVCAELRALNPDVIVVAAYGKILPREMLDIPKHGCVNIHASLLPKYRGAAPIQWAIVNGENETGVTTMLMSEGLDEGDILLVDKTRIGPRETAGELYGRLSKMGSGLIVETLRRIESGRSAPFPQDGSEASYAPIIKKSDARIDFTKSPFEIVNLVRGFNPWPVAFADIGGAPLKVFSAEAEEGGAGGRPGEVLMADAARGLKIACEGGAVTLLDVQPQGKRVMTAREYLMGYPIKEGTVIGRPEI